MSVQDVADERVLHLITIGRKTGLLREIEIWFVVCCELSDPVSVGKICPLNGIQFLTDIFSLKAAAMTSCSTRPVLL